LIPPALYLREASAKGLLLESAEQWFRAARSAELFAVSPEAPWGSGSAWSFRESDPVPVVSWDHQGPGLVAASTAVFAPVRRSFRRTRDMQKRSAELKYEI